MATQCLLGNPPWELEEEEEKRKELFCRRLYCDWGTGKLVLRDGSLVAGL